jgi:hypothetical protein
LNRGTCGNFSSKNLWQFPGDIIYPVIKELW